MLQPIARWRHGVIVAVVAVLTLLAWGGIIGGGNYPERFDSKHITVQPDGDNGLRIREVVDQDFGSNDRHGYQRTIPTDFGVPTDITASSPDAPDHVYTSMQPGGLQIRVGDPDTTVSGRHRYVLTYTLPEAQVDSGELALDIIGTQDTLETERLEVVVTGLELRDPLCNVGGLGESGGCTLEQDGDVYRTVISPLEPEQGVTIGGTITDRTDPAEVSPPPPPEPREGPGPIVPIAVGVGSLLAAAIVFFVVRHLGGNEVFRGGAADAAFGPLRKPRSTTGAQRTAAGAADGGSGNETTTVSDAELAEMATIEFAPPSGLSPWQGSVLLRERLDDDTVSAWFSDLVAREVIELEEQGGDLVVSKGRRIDEHTRQEGAVLGEAFGLRDSFTLGTYDEEFASAWKQTQEFQANEIQQSGWWKRGTPRPGGGVRMRQSIIMLAIGAWVFFGAIVAALIGFVRSPVGAIVICPLAVALVAFVMYRTLLPGRSATGSALALRTESFRRFLEASEGRHVQWAWEQGVVREYSAWAVALGTADAWRDALQASELPQAELSMMTTPLLIYSMGGLFHSSFTPPAPTGGGGFGGGGFGGFSGGMVGGGGGGGGSGSW